MHHSQPGTAPTKYHNVNPHLWVKSYADYLYHYAMSRISDEEVARDLVQETFLAALEQLEKFEGRSSERTWLTAILKNKIIDVYRKRSSAFVNNHNTESADYHVIEFFEKSNGHWHEANEPAEFAKLPDDRLLSKEFDATLERCLRKLPALWFAVFTMKHMDDASTRDICRELRVSAANYWVIIHRAKLNLRACLQKNWH